MFVGTAWNNGSPRGSGSGYGIKLKAEDRDRYFSRKSKYVSLRLEGPTRDIPANTDKPSFWSNACRELINKEIGLWLISNGMATWMKGHPPKLQLEPAGEQRFNVTILQEPGS